MSYAFEAGPIGFVIWSYGLAAVTGIAFWALTIRYKLADEPIKFTPHPSSPPR